MSRTLFRIAPLRAVLLLFVAALLLGGCAVELWGWLS